MTWNCNGVGPLLKNTDNLRELNDMLRSRSVDILVVQEAKLRAHESGNQELVSVKDQPLLDAFMLYFPEYICVTTLDLERKYAGQLML